MVEQPDGAMRRAMNMVSEEQSLGLLQFYVLFPNLLFALAVIYWVRRQGERWLRLEDSPPRVSQSADSV